MWHNFFPWIFIVSWRAARAQRGPEWCWGTGWWVWCKVAVPPAGYCVAGRAAVFVSLWEPWQSHSLSHCDGPMRMETRPEGGTHTLHLRRSGCSQFKLFRFWLWFPPGCEIHHKRTAPTSHLALMFVSTVTFFDRVSTGFVQCDSVRSQVGKLEYKEKHAWGTNLRWDHWWMWLQRLYGNRK